jgi:hypothetical protein
MPTTSKSPIDQIKEFCGLLSAVGVTSVRAEYSGSGDSGDYEAVYFSFLDPKSKNDSQLMENVENNRQLSALQMSEFKSKYVHKEGAIITAAALDAFEQNLWSVLPGGWENDCGGFGEITVDTNKKKIHLVHNQRVEEIVTEETDF